MAKGVAGRTQGVYQADGGFQTDSGVLSVWEERTLEEEGAAGVYTMAPVNIPAGATILDIKVKGTVLWGAGTSAALIVGDTEDPNGFYDAVDLKATDLLADEEANFDNITEHGVPGVYLVAVTNLRNTYRAAATQVTAQVTTVGTTSSVGRTRVLVNYVVPVDLVKPHTYVAT